MRQVGDDRSGVPGEGRRLIGRRPDRFWRRALIILLIVVGLSSTAIVLLDRRPLIYDPLTNLLPAVVLRQVIEGSTHIPWNRWVRLTDFRPPLPTLLYQPLLWLLPNQVHAMRLTDIAFFLLVLWLLYDIGRRLGGSALSGFFAALFLAAFPLTQGWSRVGNADPIIWGTLLLLFRILLWLDLRSPWQAVALGLAMGLCLATRLLCLIFLVGPALWLLITRVRSLRSGVNLVAAAIFAINLTGWWYVMQLRAVLDNIVMSSETQGLSGASHFGNLDYLSAGYLWLLLPALLSLGWLWRRRLLSRSQTGLFVLWVAVPVIQLLTLWDFWARYPLPLLPQLALLSALGLDQVTRPLRPRVRRLVLAGAVAAALVPMAAYYGGIHSFAPGMVPRPLEQDRAFLQLKDVVGLMKPDHRRYEGMMEALTPLRRGTHVVVINETVVPNYERGILWTWRDAPYTLWDPPDPDLIFGVPRNLRVRHVLRIRPRCDRAEFGVCELLQENPWFTINADRVITPPMGTGLDPSGIAYSLYALKEPL